MNICRICLKDDQLKKLKIFNVLDDNTTTYCDILSMILHPVPVDMNPKLPQNLCLMCKEKLVIVFKLRQLCFTSDRSIKATIYGDLNANCVANVLTPNILLRNNSEVEPLVLDQLNINEREDQSHSCENVNEIRQNEKRVQQVVKKRRHSCKRCFKKFITLSGYLRHKRQEHKPRYKCKLCSVAYDTNRNLKIHLKSAKHSQKLMNKIGPDRAFVCEKCPEGFTFIEEYSKHMLKHLAVRMDVNNVVCQDCGRCYTTIRHLKRHQLTKHAE